MSEHHLHLLVNHVPIMGCFFGLIVLIAGMVMGNKTVKRTGYIMLVASAVFTLPAFFTGEGAEEVVEELGTASHDVIHEHEEMAELSLWLAEIMGIAAFISLMLDIRNHKWNALMNILTLVISILCFGSLIRTGNSGGEIRRPEIRSTTSEAFLKHYPTLQIEKENFSC